MFEQEVYDNIFKYINSHGVSNDLAFIIIFSSIILFSLYKIKNKNEEDKLFFKIMIIGSSFFLLIISVIAIIWKQ